MEKYNPLKTVPPNIKYLGINGGLKQKLYNEKYKSLLEEKEKDTEK